MSIMAKTPSGYKKIGSAYLGEQPVDKVFNANGDVVYALQRELTGVPPLLFKGKEQSELLNYRIYGDTVDGNNVGDLVESGEHAGEYKVPVTVEGKNLLQNTATSQTINGVTFTVNDDGSVTCNGTASNAIYFSFATNLESGTYIISGTPRGMTESNAIIFINANYSTIGLSGNVRDNDGNGKQFVATQSGTATLTITIKSGYTCNNLTFYPMIRKADIEDDTYEPYHAPVTTPIYLPEPIKMVGDEAEYVDYAEQKQHRVRKNLLQNTATSRTINGVTFTVNEDGSVTCNGTCVSNVAYFHIKNSFKFDDETIRYTLTGCPQGGGYKSTYTLEYSNAVNQARTDSGDGVSFAPYSAVDYPNAWVRIIIFVGYTCNNLTFYPMIRRADIEDDTYEPYIKNTDLDVTLPALPTLPGTNVLSVDTEVQPSRMDIKGRIKSLT